MKNIERDKYLTTLLGYRYLRTEGNDIICSIPNYGPAHLIPWQFFGLLFEWSNKQEWWLEFWLQDDLGLQYGLMGMLAFINPNCFADAVYKFLKEKK